MRLLRCYARVRRVATGGRWSPGGGRGDEGGKGETNVYTCVYIYKTGDQRRGGGKGWQVKAMSQGWTGRAG